MPPSLPKPTPDRVRTLREHQKESYATAAGEEPAEEAEDEIIALHATFTPSKNRSLSVSYSSTTLSYPDEEAGGAQEAGQPSEQEAKQEGNKCLIS